MTMNDLRQIEYGKIPKVLFLGNGVNLATRSKDDLSWGELLKRISSGKHDYNMDRIEKMPYPLQAVVLTEDNIDNRLEEISKTLLPKELSDNRSSLLRKYTELSFDAILTTNYTYEIEMALNSEFNCKLKSPSKWRKSAMKGSKIQEQFGLFKFMKLADEDSDYYVWHIHGEAARPRSMVLGHYYYSKLLRLIQDRVANTVKRYKTTSRNKMAFTPQSWIDYFLLGDVYVVGYGLDFSEMDIWWLINCKKRNFSECGDIFYYEPGLSKSGDKYAKRALADSYGVEMPEIDFDGDYYLYYRKVAEDIEVNRMRRI